MEQKLKKKLVRRTRLTLKAELNSKKTITAIKMLAICVITYSFNIIDWNLSEVKRLDTKVRKMMTRHSIITQRSMFPDFTSQEVTGEGFDPLELSYKTSFSILELIR